MDHQHRTPQSCPTCQDWPDWARHLAAQINHLDKHLTNLDDLLAKTNRTITRKAGQIMTQASDNQAHLDQDVAAIGESIATAVQELKDQIAQGATAQQLNFTRLDDLAASTAAEATADAPVTPPTP